MKTSVPARIVRLGEGDDFQAVLWASLGRSYRFIQSKTGLTYCQIGYRLRKAGVRTTDYRNGLGVIAEEIDRRIIHNFEGRLRKEMKLIG